MRTSIIIIEPSLSVCKQAELFNKLSGIFAGLAAAYWLAVEFNYGNYVFCRYGKEKLVGSLCLIRRY